MLLAVGVLWGGHGVLNSIIARSGRRFIPMMATNTLLGSTGATLLFVRFGALRQMIDGADAKLALFILIMLAGGGLAGAGFLVVQRAMREGHQAVVWTVAQSAMLIPFTAAMLFWNEFPAPLGGLGAGLLLLGLIGFGRAKSTHHEDPTTGRRAVAWAMLACLLFGVSQTLVSIPSHQHWADPAHIRTPLYVMGQILVFVPLALRRAFPRRGEAMIGVIYATFTVVSLAILYTALDRLAVVDRSGIAFPTAVGTCVCTMALYSLLVLREKTSAWVLGALAISITGIALLAFA